MPVVHTIVGSLLIVVNTLVAVWGFVAYRRNAPPGELFRQALALAQTLVIAQATLGLVLISQGLRPGDQLHFVYGLLPLLAVAYPYALRGEDGPRGRPGRPRVHDRTALMTRETLRGFLIVIGLAIISTVFFSVSSSIFAILLGTIGLIFIVLMWYFGYAWYRSNRMTISLMPDRQRQALYAGMGAVTVAAGAYSLSQFGLLTLGGFTLPLVIIALAGGFAMLWAWEESKRYHL
jgi:hypothetical protein